MGIKLHEFHMSADTVRYIFKSGKIAHFHGGVYRTESESEAKELKDEIAAGIGAIWQNKGTEIVDSDDIDPIAVFKRKVIAEYEANKARSLANGESISDVSGMKPAGTGTVGVTAAVSNSVGGARAVTPGSIKLSK